MSENGSHFAGADRAAGYGVEDLTTPPIRRPRPAEPAAARPEEMPAYTLEQPQVAAQSAAQTPVVEQPAPVAPASAMDVLRGVVDADVTATAPKVATEGWRGFLARIGFRPQPGPAEAAKLERLAQLRRHETTIRQATYTRPVGVLVANPKGDAGKTTVSLALGGVLAFCRGGGVAIAEVAEDPGTLTLRSEGSPHRGIGHLVADHATIRSAGQLDGYTAPQTSFARVVGSTGPREPLTAEAVTNVVRVIDEYFPMRVMDSGNQYTSAAFRAAVEAADVLVIPTLNATDTATQAMALLQALRTQGGHAADLADRAIVLVLTDGRKEVPAVAQAVAEAFAASNVGEVLPIPFDEHLAERGQITLGRMSTKTYRAFVAAGAAVIRALEPVTR